MSETDLRRLVNTVLRTQPEANKFCLTNEGIGQSVFRSPGEKLKRSGRPLDEHVDDRARIGSSLRDNYETQLSQ